MHRAVWQEAQSGNFGKYEDGNEMFYEEFDRSVPPQAGRVL